VVDLLRLLQVFVTDGLHVLAPGAAPVLALLHQSISGIYDSATHYYRCYRAEMPLQVPCHFVRQYRAILAFERLKDDVGRHVVEQAPAEGQFILFVTVDRQQVPVDVEVGHALLVVLSFGAIGAARDAIGFVLIVRDYVHLG